jgi:transcription elongation factor Elf1
MMNHSQTRVHYLKPQTGLLRNLNYCGFECPSCGYQHRLSDTPAGVPIIDLFRASECRTLGCPECGVRTDFERSDLKLFGGGFEG